jgi:hypothetical protein
MSLYSNFRNYAQYEPEKCDQKIDYSASYYDLSPNANGNDCTKVWYKMKNGYIYQYTYSTKDNKNYVTARGYQRPGNTMVDLINIYNNNKKI